VPTSARDAIYENAKRHFAHAIFYKPGSDEDILPSELAPLIVQEIASDCQARQRAMKFGRVSLDLTGQVEIDLDDPTVYVDERSITIRGQSYTERVFSLYFRPVTADTDAGILQSIHTILDADNFPLATLVWDIWFQERRQRCGYSVFMSQQLEDRVKSRYGDPLEGCRHSGERKCQNRCDPIVSAVFATGPTPMGPYVYLGDRGIVTAVLCRCSPSQMDDVTATHNYRMEPIESALAVREKLGGRQHDEFPVPLTSEYVAHLLERALRWPFDPPKEEKPDENR